MDVDASVESQEDAAALSLSFSYFLAVMEVPSSEDAVEDVVTTTAHASFGFYLSAAYAVMVHGASNNKLAFTNQMHQN